MPEDQHCPNCGKELEAGATTCAHCGARYGRNRGALFIAIALFLVGSGLWQDGWLMPMLFWGASAAALKYWLRPTWMIRDTELHN